jgi:hypothetical protein
VVDVEGVPIVVDARLFDLGGVDMVLGIEWLRTLGDMIMNWKKHRASFWYNQEWITLKGMEERLGVMDTLQNIVCKSMRSDVGWWKDRENVKDGGSFQALEVGQSKELDAEVFQEPTGLPPRGRKNT